MPCAPFSNLLPPDSIHSASFSGFSSAVLAQAGFSFLHKCIPRPTEEPGDYPQDEVNSVTFTFMRHIEKL